MMTESSDFAPLIGFVMRCHAGERIATDILPPRPGALRPPPPVGVTIVVLQVLMFERRWPPAALNLCENAVVWRDFWES